MAVWGGPSTCTGSWVPGRHPEPAPGAGAVRRGRRGWAAAGAGAWRAAAALAGALILLAVAGCGRVAVDYEQVSPAERLVVRFSHPEPEASPLGLAARRLAELARQYTGGRVEVQVYANSTLFGEADEVEALRQGRLQMAAPATAVLGAAVPGWQVFDLPYAFPTRDAAHRLWAGPAGDRLRQQAEAAGLKVLGLWEDGYRDLVSARRPLVAPADFRGQVIRVAPGSPLRYGWASMGATVRRAPLGEVYAALQAGEVDAQEATAALIWAQQAWRLQRYITVSRHAYSAHVVVVGAAWWDQVPPPLREALREAVAEVSAWLREQAPQLQARAMTRLQLTDQVQVHILSPAEQAAWQRHLAAAWDAVEQQVGPDLIAQVRAAAVP